jgi:TonB family protein
LSSHLENIIQMRTFFHLVFFAVFIAGNTFAQSGLVLKYYNDGLIALKNNQCHDADSLFKKSASMLPHKDTYHNLALARNCLNDHDGFCYYMILAKEMGDTVAHLNVKKYCQNFDKMEYLEKNNPLPKSKKLPDTSVALQIVEVQPEFPGGEMALMHYLGKNINYPHYARESGIQGTVFVNFVIEPDGSVTNVKIIKGIGGGCDEEAIRVILNMPKWKPGYQKGEAVRVQFNLPIRFILDIGSKDIVNILNDGEKALKDGDCIKAEAFYADLFATKKKKEIRAVDYFNMAMVKICLKDSSGYCYYLNLSTQEKYQEAEKYYRLDCKNFNPDAYKENLKIMETIQNQQNNIKVCEEVFKVTDIQPVFPGDISALNEFIYSKLEYPKQALKNNISGKVYLSFIITDEGKIESIVVLKGIGSGCDEEALRIVKSMPNWTPGKIGNDNVCVQYTLTIKFELSKTQ